ncbi:2-isopropylmalate synthase [Ignisphaera sp. 4213-co]|uniref:2-isopropylmalate synthase n=1 Tax=Ignisphaera cupida TaxID=3050454 RepID=A0ABD4Z873_9CREN|nr:2-isopropylmalate synthase [Ignisphaera sp. 4213-co]MDK6029128.1 2-isopropylmalate synthase [Ignisphaera sp. 4213-co]
MELNGDMKFFRDIYPFESVPRFNVTDQELRENLSKIFLTDTTLRDGQQGWRVFTIDECEKIYELLADIGGRGGIESTEVFLYTEKDREAVKRLLAYGYRYPKVIGWIRATNSDLQLVIDAKLDETVMLMSISDYHIKYKFNATREEAFRKYLEVAEKALSHGITIRASLEDITRADIFGAVIPFVKRLLELSEKYRTPVKIKLPDTLGLGLPFPEVPLPRGIPAIIQAIRKTTNIPQEYIEFHGHNDFGLVVANHLAAWMYGAAAGNCTLLGIGERAGNCPLEIMAVHYAGIKGVNNINLKALSKLPELFEKMGLKIIEHYPLVGRNAFRTKAGIHADGLLKNPEVYLPFDPMKVLGLPYSVAITPYSGRSAVVIWLRNYLGYNHISKDDPRVVAVYNEIVDLFNKTGRVEPLSDSEMLEIVKKHFPEVRK